MVRKKETDLSSSLVLAYLHEEHGKSERKTAINTRNYH